MSKDDAPMVRAELELPPLPLGAWPTPQPPPGGQAISASPFDNADPATREAIRADLAAVYAKALASREARRTNRAQSDS